MGKMFRWVLLGLVGSACATTGAAQVPDAPAGISYSADDGLSCATSVKIYGASSSRDGVPAEYAWLRAKYPDAQLERQALSECNGRQTDILTIRTADGRSVPVYFDIEEFFGKF